MVDTTAPSKLQGRSTPNVGTMDGTGTELGDVARRRWLP